MTDAVSIYVAALQRAVEQLTQGREPAEIEAAADLLKELDPSHPAIPALYERVRERRERTYLH
ncbi:hypothetical protein [Salinarimonas soli]|uniref:Uncharacterized protein n=1 Tax=Salinarimonas soli TaxID=1638099 RepID=A0A5B2V9Z3_9HYPH|nr:hypothetical protein [Salinarimonas soli]KAA2235057.1 hypothetical protein F0L46_22250 [Salinarimonas soli]